MTNYWFLGTSNDFDKDIPVIFTQNYMTPPSPRMCTMLSLNLGGFNFPCIFSNDGFVSNWVEVFWYNVTVTLNIYIRSAENVTI